MAEAYIGEIRMFGGNFAIRGWAFCHGQLMAISQNTALFSLIGTTYGGDGRTTFALPDLRGRAPVGFGDGPGLQSVREGQKLGAEQAHLTQQNLPPHTFSTKASVAIPAVTNSRSVENAPSASTYLSSLSVPGNSETGVYAAGEPNTTLAPFDVDINLGTLGGGEAVQTRGPGLGMNFIICLEGIFPSRS
ncbi:phage tail protein [Gilvimarinus xylanilyticus]|uniref:Tail fiber protein n=1 Tax=Gilvimarinus xylanilyticus TaxID=2944139 RepID=A0A9X2HVZ3_9GAMM|nr:tail fiber protein [Gilvimarinus xylanilyticus]MCP8898014.1 tail fiber protein [Gilvimarinus xylanilyticus]